MVICDILAMLFSSLLLLYLEKGIMFDPSFDRYAVIKYVGFAIGTIIIMGFILGVYRSTFHDTLRRQYYLAGKSYVISILLMNPVFYLFTTQRVSNRYFEYFFMLTPLVFILCRYLLNITNKKMQTKGYGIYKTLIVGYEDSGIEIFKRFTRFPELGYAVMGFVVNGNGESIMPKIPGLNMYKFEELEDVIKNEGIHRIFIPSSNFLRKEYSEVIAICRKYKIKLKILSPESDQLLSLSKVSGIAGITLYAPGNKIIEKAQKYVKRGFDFVGSVALIVILSPVFLIVSIAIGIESGFPIHFAQRRGLIKGGRSFKFIKFRSMVKNADEMKDSLLQLNESDGGLFKMKNDPRMTKVGRFIRKFSIDELPQLFNVLIGDMSLVGPRPLPIPDLNNVEGGSDDYWDAIKDRQKTKSGMTGLWQILGRGDVGFREMILLDLYYVENRSLAFDLEILVETIPVVLFGKGGY
jgi:exopolysaccharide biosynthesis polyprenyl glycosylphosphotransferase